MFSYTDQEGGDGVVVAATDKVDFTTVLDKNLNEQRKTRKMCSTCNKEQLFVRSPVSFFCFYLLCLFIVLIVILKCYCAYLFIVPIVVPIYCSYCCSYLLSLFIVIVVRNCYCSYFLFLFVLVPLFCS